MNSVIRCKWILLWTTALALSGCFSPMKNLNVMRMGPPYQVTAYQQGQPIAERKLDAMSAEELVIARWIEANREGWRPSHTNAPPGRVIKGDGFTLNFTEDMCYLYIPPDPTASNKHRKGKGITEPILMQKRLTPGDIELAQVLGAGV